MKSGTKDKVEGAVKEATGKLSSSMNRSTGRIGSPRTSITTNPSLSRRRSISSRRKLRRVPADTILRAELAASRDRTFGQCQLWRPKMQATNASYRHHGDKAKPHQNDNHTHLTTHSRPGPIRNILCCRHVH